MKTQVLIPAAGQGSRFVAKGYSDPKPFIWSVRRQKRLVEIAVEDAAEALGSDLGEVFVALRAEHVQRGEALLGSRARVVPVGALTTGAASTVQLAEPYLDPDAPVLVLNSDQTFAVSIERFTEARQRADAAAVCLTFRPKRDFSKWSYFDPQTKQIVEKPIVPPEGLIATVGAYWFRSAREMFDAVLAMKGANFKVNGEYYFAPCHNYLASGDIIPLAVSKFAGLGTPEDLEIHEKAVRAGSHARLGPEAVVANNAARQRKWQARRRRNFQPLPPDHPYAGAGWGQK